MAGYLFPDESWDSGLPGEAGFFESSAWARILMDCYGHRPFYMRIGAGGMNTHLPMMEVSSWATGRRGVSLPFTDFCGTSNPAHGARAFELLCALGRERRWRHFELRGASVAPADAPPSSSFHSHLLDLTPGAACVRAGYAPAVRRALRKARESGVEVEVGAGSGLMEEYYALHVLTRKRHGLPPQSWRFFAALHQHAIATGAGFVAIARKAGRALAGAVFLHSARKAIYKYGAADAGAQTLRPSNMVMAAAIEHLISLGMESLHFGRTDWHSEGLRRFKQGWGTAEKELRYHRFDLSRNQWVTAAGRVSGWHNRIFARLPLWANRVVGAILYPHLD